MVYFTCNACGSSLKKNQVEKHYATTCRHNVVMVSCMDCGKDFPGESYVAHNKCISEAEKYSGKDWQPKQNQNKNEKKQTEWVDLVNEIIKSHTNLPGPVKQLLETTSGFDNIPRKKPKFQNFVRNVAKFANQATIDQTFELLQSAFIAKKEGKNNQGNENKDKEKNGDAENDAEEKDVEENETEKKLSKKERKELRKKEKHKVEKKDSRGPTEDDEDETSKHKKRKHRGSETDTHDADDVLPEGPDYVSKKKKSKRERKHERRNSEEVESPELVNGDVEVATEKKKKKHNKNGVEDSTEELANGDVEVAAEKKKKKHYKNGVEDSTEELANGDVVSEKKKKKKHGKNGVEENTEELTNGHIEATSKSKKKKKHGKNGVEENTEETSVTNDDERRSKKKRKRNKSATDEEDIGKEGKLNDTVEDEVQVKGKFHWDRTIRAILRATDDKEISLKKFSKKVLSEYQSQGGDGKGEKTKEEILAKLEKKLKQMPSVCVAKERVYIKS